MKKTMKKGIAAIMAAAMLMGGTMTSYAGTWKFDGPADWQWWYQNDNGGYTANDWQKIDGKWYHFDQDGYLDVGLRQFGDDVYYNLMNSGAMETNHDYGTGYFNADGAWVSKGMTEQDFANETNTAWDYCTSWGVDMDTIISNLMQSLDYTYTCSTAAFPVDSEGAKASGVVAISAQDAVVNFANMDGIPTTFWWNYWVSEDGTTANIRFFIPDEYKSYYGAMMTP